MVTEAMVHAASLQHILMLSSQASELSKRILAKIASDSVPSVTPPALMFLLSDVVCADSLQDADVKHQLHAVVLDRYSTATDTVSHDIFAEFKCLSLPHPFENEK